VDVHAVEVRRVGRELQADVAGDEAVLAGAEAGLADAAAGVVDERGDRGGPVALSSGIARTVPPAARASAAAPARVVAMRIGVPPAFGVRRGRRTTVCRARDRERFTSVAACIGGGGAALWEA
jgi:hypothetical protein